MIRRALGLLLALGLTACGATVEPPAPVEVRISSTEGAAAMAHRVGEAVSREKPHLSFAVSEEDAARSLERLAAGEADVAIVSALLPGAESFRQIPVARDGLAVIVHPDNRVDNLTLLDLRALYAGRMLSWRDVGGNAMAVQPAVRERGAGSNEIFSAQVMQGTRITPNARVFPNDRAVLAFVARTPGAVGYVSAALPAEGVKVVAVEEVSPAPETVSNGAYPLTYLLYALTLPAPAPAAQEFVAFWIAPAGQEMATSAGLGRIR